MQESGIQRPDPAGRELHRCYLFGHTVSEKLLRVVSTLFRVAQLLQYTQAAGVTSHSEPSGLMRNMYRCTSFCSSMHSLNQLNQESVSSIYDTGYTNIISAYGSVPRQTAANIARDAP